MIGQRSRSKLSLGGTQEVGSVPQGSLGLYSDGGEEIPGSLMAAGHRQHPGSFHFSKLHYPIWSSVLQFPEKIKSFLEKPRVMSGFQSQLRA